MARAGGVQSSLDSGGRTLTRPGSTVMIAPFASAAPCALIAVDSRQAVVSGADVYQSQDASMGNASDDGQFAEVLVEGDHGLLMFRGVGENREVSGILGPVGDRLSLVAGVSKGDLR